MSFILPKTKYNELSVFSTIFFIITLSIQIASVNCDSLNTSEIINYNKTIYRYHQALFNFRGLSKKMEKITLNIYLNSLFKDLSNNYEDVKTEMLKLKTNQEKNELISDNIIMVDKYLKIFEKNYKRTLNTYKRFDETKKFIFHLFKIFIIVLSVIIIISLIGIGIGSYFVIKSQKKYYKLQEEISVRIGQNYNIDKDKITSDGDDDNKNKKMIYSMKSSQENIHPTNAFYNNNQVVLESNNHPVSKDYLKNKQ